MERHFPFFPGHAYKTSSVGPGGQARRRRRRRMQVEDAGGIHAAGLTASHAHSASLLTTTTYLDTWQHGTDAPLRGLRRGAHVRLCCGAHYAPRAKAAAGALVRAATVWRTFLSLLLTPLPPSLYIPHLLSFAGRHALRRRRRATAGCCCFAFDTRTRAWWRRRRVSFGAAAATYYYYLSLFSGTQPHRWCFLRRGVRAVYTRHGCPNL